MVHWKPVPIVIANSGSTLENQLVVYAFEATQFLCGCVGGLPPFQSAICCLIFLWSHHIHLSCYLIFDWLKSDAIQEANYYQAGLECQLQGYSHLYWGLLEFHDLKS